MTDRPRSDRPMTDFLLEAAENPQLHLELADNPEAVVNERFGEGSPAAMCLLSGDANAVAAFVQNEHAGVAGVTQYDIVVVDETIRLLICVIPPNGG